MKTQNNQDRLYYAIGILFTVIAISAIVTLLRLKSLADTTTQSAEVGNTNPAVDSIVVSDQSGTGDIGLTGFIPNQGTTKRIYVRGTISDQNGCSDISSVAVAIRRTPLTASCTSDKNDCYHETVTAFTGCTGPGDNDAEFEAYMDVANYVDPTDTGSPYADKKWTATAEITDAASGSGTLSTDFTVNSLAAFDINPDALSYGTLSLGSVSTEQQLEFTNSGNRRVDSLVDANHDFTSDLNGFSDIPSTQVHFSLDNPFVWADASSTPNHVDGQQGERILLGLDQQTNDLAASGPKEQAYFALKIPAQGVNGTYTNMLTLTAVVAAGGGQQQSGTLTGLSLLGSVDFGDNSGGFANDGSNVYATYSWYVDEANWGVGFKPISVADPANPVVGTGIDWNSSWASVDAIYSPASISGNYAYFVNGGFPGSDGNLAIVDITNPASPVLVSTSTVGTANGTRDFKAVGRYGYLIHYGNNAVEPGFYVIDLIDPANPTIVASVADQYGGQVLKIFGSYAYVLTEGTFDIVDISNPLAPALVKSIEGSWRDLDYRDGIVYLLHFSEMMTIMDISNLASPQVLSTTTVSPSFYQSSITVSGNYAYITDAEETGQFFAYDISNPAEPTSVSSADLTYNESLDGATVYVSGNHAYVIEVDNGVLKTFSLLGL